jgi:hypothetical protein
MLTAYYAKWDRLSRGIMKKMTWDQAIRDAKIKLSALRKTIKYFEEMKRKREPWPGKQFRSATTRELAHYRQFQPAVLCGARIGARHNLAIDDKRGFKRDRGRFIEKRFEEFNSGVGQLPRACNRHHAPILT